MYNSAIVYNLILITKVASKRVENRNILVFRMPFVLHVKHMLVLNSSVNVGNEIHMIVTLCLYSISMIFNLFKLSKWGQALNSCNCHVILS